MSEKISLKSTGEEVFEMPWGAQSPKPWGPGYVRVVIPRETLYGNVRGYIQIVRNDNLRRT